MTIGTIRAISIGDVGLSLLIPLPAFANTHLGSKRSTGLAGVLEGTNALLALPVCAVPVEVEDRYLTRQVKPRHGRMAGVEVALWPRGRGNERFTSLGDGLPSRLCALTGYRGVD